MGLFSLSLLVAISQAATHRVSVHIFSSTGSHKYECDASVQESLWCQQIRAATGFYFAWNEQIKVIQMTAQRRSFPKASLVQLNTPEKIEIAGETIHNLELTSPGVEVTARWKNLFLRIDSPRCHIAKTGLLEVKSMEATHLLINEGKIQIVDLYVGDLANRGHIESSSVLSIIRKNASGSKVFFNTGAIVAPSIYIKNLLQKGRFLNKKIGHSEALINTKTLTVQDVPLKNAGNIIVSEDVKISGSGFVNQGDFHAGGALHVDLLQDVGAFINKKGRTIHAKKLTVSCGSFNNTGDILIAEDAQIIGAVCTNQGNVHAEGVLYTNCATITNDGRLHGKSKTELVVQNSLANDGIVGSRSSTAIKLESDASAHIDGRIEATDLGIAFSKSGEVSGAGTFSAQDYVSLRADKKASLGAIQVHTPLLNIFAPDFSLQSQKECTNTVIHCLKDSQFTLTSPYRTDGKVIVLQSCPEAACSVQDLQKQIDGARAARQDDFCVKLHADVHAAKDIDLIVPGADIHISCGSTVTAESLRTWVRSISVRGAIAVKNATIKAPQGISIEDQESLGAVFATENAAYFEGPFNCKNSTFQIGGDCEIKCDCSACVKFLESTVRIGGNLLLSGQPEVQVHGKWHKETSEVERTGTRVSPEPHRTIELVPNPHPPALGWLLPFLYLEARIIESTRYEEYKYLEKIEKTVIDKEACFRVEKAIQAENPITINLAATTFHMDALDPNITLKFETPMSPSIGQGGLAHIEGNRDGLISSPQLVLLEKHGDFFLALKNPAYFEKKNPIQDLMAKAFPSGTVYMPKSLQEEMQRDASRFHYVMREQFFFRPIISEQFYAGIQDAIVVYADKSFKNHIGAVLFSISPQLLLQQVQDACQDALKRGYVYEDRPIDLEFLAELHRNAAELLNHPGAIDLAGHHALQKPMIFYRKLVNEQGLDELKPFFYIPPAMLEATHANESNVLAKIFARFPNTMTPEAILDCLPDGTIKEYIITYLTENKSRKEGIRQAALEARKTATVDNVVITAPLAPHAAIVANGDLIIKRNQDGQSLALIATNGSVTLASKKAKKIDSEHVDDQREIKTAGDLYVRAGQNIATTGVKFHAHSAAFKAGGSIIDQPLPLESTGSGAQVYSQLSIQNTLRMQASSIALISTHADAGDIQIGAKEQLIVDGAHKYDSLSQKTESESGWFILKKKKASSTSEAHTTFVPAALTARNTIDLAGKNVTLRAPELTGTSIEIQGDTVKLLQGTNSSQKSLHALNESMWWVSADTSTDATQTYTQALIKGKVKIRATKLELEEIKGKTLAFIDNLEYSNVEVVRNVLEEMHKHDEKSISAPGPALIASVAIAASIATAGAGGAAVAAVGMKAGSVAAVATSAAISSLTAQVATQLTLGVLANQSPEDILNTIVRTETLKSMVTASLTAGVLCEVHGLQDAMQTSAQLRHVENACSQAAVGMGVDLACGQDLETAATNAGIQCLGQAAGGIAANEIGQMNDRVLHKVAHGVSAAAMSAGCAALADRDVAVAAAAAAAGAMTSEIVADILAQPLQEDVTQEIQAKREEYGRALTAEEVRDIWDAKATQITQIAKLTGALSGLFTGDAEGIALAYTAGNNAIDNNFMQKTMPVLWAAMELGLLEAAGTLKIAPAPDMTGIRTLDQPSLDQKAKELQQDPGYQASNADMGMGTTGDAPVGVVADAGSTAGHALLKVPESGVTDFEGKAHPEVRGPSESKHWKALGPYRGKYKTSGEGRDKRYYNWDYTHQDIEVYGRNGKHLGSLDPTTGEMTKPPIKGRKMENK